MLRILLLSVALAAAGGAAWLVEAVKPNEANATSATEDPPPVPLAEVLVAAVDLPAGTTLKPEDLRWQAWPADAVNPSFVRYAHSPTAPADMTGMVLRAPLLAGSPVLPDQVGNTASGFLSAALTPGFRAVAIPVSAERTAGGFILPNNRVDVLLAVSCEGSGEGCVNGIKVRTILQDVRVLAIDQAGAENAEAAAVVGKTATLELAPRDAETLVAAEAAGRLSLVLRSVQDEGVLIPTETAATNPAAAANEPAKRIRVMRGGVASYYELD
jgi:pilus assembly protein CpaB